MGKPVPLPLRASLRDLLTDLLGQEVTVTDAPRPLEISAQRKDRLAVYRDDAAAVAALQAFEAPLAVGAGGALGMVPPSEVAEAAASGEDADGELGEFFHEVANIMARLLNSPTTPHVALRSVHEIPGEVTADVARVALAPTRRVDYRVRVGEYGEGTVALLAA